MDTDRLDKSLLLRVSSVQQELIHPCSFLLLLQPAHALLSVQSSHDITGGSYLPEYSLSSHRTYRILPSCTQQADLSVHTPEVRYPDEADPYHQCDPSSGGR